MKKLISLLSICALCTGSLFAQNHTPPQVRQVKRAITTENVFAPQHYKLQPTASTRMLADVPENAIIWEDFSKFTEGSETTPGTVEVGDSEGNIPSEMTQMPGWVGVGVFQAGGAAYIGFFEGVYGKETGLITTPTVDFSANNGAVTLKFRAKSNATKDKLLVLLMESGMQYASSSARIDLTNEWTDYTILLDKGTEASFIQMYTQTEGWFIDDFQVIPEGTSSPDNIRVTSYKGTEATVAWDAIDGATYEYSLLHPDPNTGETIVDQGNVPTSNTSVTLTGLDPNLTYGIQVASVFNGAKSPLSALTIISPVLDGPTPTSPTDYDGTSFVAHWEAMENAATYTVYVSHSESNGMFETTVVDQKQTTSENSYKVTGLDPQIIYSYSVQAKLEDGEITMISEMVKVAPTIAAPVATEATEVTDNSFVANWNASERATHYQVTAYKEHTALTAGEYAVANADFSYIESTGTLETPEGIAQEYITPTESGAFNWNINLTAMMEGAIGLNNSYVGFLGRAFMHSPLYDLTPFGNKATFDITLASTDVTTAVIALAYVDEDRKSSHSKCLFQLNGRNNKSSLPRAARQSAFSSTRKMVRTSCSRTSS